MRAAARHRLRLVLTDGRRLVLDRWEIEDDPTVFDVLTGYVAATTANRIREALDALPEEEEEKRKPWEW